ncbi:zinc finger protein 2 homolog isoform X1 [Rhopalosiphum maidis]|uniref:zinc finger protein 2 homolog isoform X1 n=1 Tax=Rhopalosiphum maidis TaxID=43146 RepID=UPI000EFFF8C7|nr:zinc finger protein 2 homolog isoform X1 [Rhopalosiphum maidis]
MDKDAYDNNDHVASEDSRRNLEIVVPRDNHKKKYRTLEDTDFYFSGYCKELNNANSVPTHENVNIGKSPLVCNVCFKPCIRKSQLCVHERTQTGEKPYECGEREKKFIISNHRTRHIRRIHIKCF